jgi:hypothetical protein
MVSKCANPECSASFRYFHKGRLFRIDTSAGQDRRRTMGRDDELTTPLRRLEFFWLCQDCSQRMTLVYDKESGVTVRTTDYAHAVAA